MGHIEIKSANAVEKNSATNLLRGRVATKHQFVNTHAHKSKNPILTR